MSLFETNAPTPKFIRVTRKSDGAEVIIATSIIASIVPSRDWTCIYTTAPIEASTKFEPNCILFSHPSYAELLRDLGLYESEAAFIAEKHPALAELVEKQ